MQFLVVALGFIIGTIFGSFAKAVADRSLTKQTFGGFSKCPQCKHQLGWMDLIPVVSYLIHRGKCAYCHRQIGKEYLFAELTLGFIVAYLFYQYSPIFINFNNYFHFSVFFSELLFELFVIVVLFILTMTDLKKMLIPDRVIYPAIGIVLVFLIILFGMRASYLYYSLSQSPIGKNLLPPTTDYYQEHILYDGGGLLAGDGLGGSIASGLGIGLFFLILIIATRGRGMGGGDFKLGIFMGLALGFPNALLALMLGFLSGAIIGVGLLALGKKHIGQTIPFGPFLSLGTLIALFWGPEIMSWYLHLQF